MSTHTKDWRISQFDEIKKLISKYKVVAIGSLENFPTALLQKLKKSVSSDVVLKVTAKNVLKRVLADLNNKDLVDKLPRQPVLILTNKNAFELYQSIKKSKSKSKAKVGMIAPMDIVIPEGDTGLPPGPALSDLKKVGLKVQVKGPTISIIEDCIVTKKGQPISSDVVSTLAKLNIKPVELMLDVVLAKEDGLIYYKDVLDVDADMIFSQLVEAVRASINLGVEIEYPAKMVIEPLIAKAERQAKALDLEVNKEKKE